MNLKNKINISEIDQNNFIVSERFLKSGERVFLVFPHHIGCSWTKQNLIFRSSIWNEKGEPVSLSYKKFFNWFEQPDLAYTPCSITANGGLNVMEKIDGSTLICSKYNGELIIRTRGTLDARTLDNGGEIDQLLNMYPQINDIPEGVSYLFEWVTPNNKIVIDYGELDIYLTNIVNHKDYTYTPQIKLNDITNELGFKQPKSFKFDSIKDLLEGVSKWEKSEGVCVYCKGDQEIRKVKGEWYLKIHKLKSQIGSFEQVVDLYFSFGCLNYIDTYNAVVNVLDYEIAEQIRGDISKIVDAYKEANKIIEGMKQFIIKNNLKDIPRKNASEKIFQAYGNTNRAGMVFLLLDDKELNQDLKKKLTYQVLK